MTDWLKNNAWALIIAGTAIVTTNAMYGFRISALEAKAADAQETINTSDTTLIQLQISTAKIQTDVSYIKQEINRIYPPVK